jgi:hypothetical protein
MRIARKDEVLAGTLALLLTAAGTTVTAAQNSEANVTGTVATPSAEAELNSRIPLPEPLNVPPPSAKDLVSTAPAQEAAP